MYSVGYHAGSWYYEKQWCGSAASTFNLKQIWIGTCACGSAVTNADLDQLTNLVEYEAAPGIEQIGSMSLQIQK